MENIKLEKVLVDVEDIGDGRQKLKRLKNGLHPIDVLSELISEENDAFRAEYGRDGCDWGTYEQPGEPGERPHLVFVLYSRETGERVPVRRFILWNRETDTPIPIPVKIPKKPGMRTMDRRDTLEHVSNFLDFKQMEAKAEARGLELRAADSWRAMEKAKRRMEG
jgi:hypothetical protein